jgi:succinyl-diaminopimelate desuccinylase
MRDVFNISAEVMGITAQVETAPYFTDASALTPALGGVPTVILGPGPAHMAHQTDEWCECARIEEAVVIYRRLIGTWCGLV